MLYIRPEISLAAEYWFTRCVYSTLCELNGVEMVVDNCQTYPYFGLLHIRKVLSAPFYLLDPNTATYIRSEIALILI